MTQNKMKRRLSAVLAIAILPFAGWSMLYGGEGQDTPYSGSDAFERMKTLVGVWQGTKTHGTEAETVTVEYRLTAGGSAIVETLFPDTPEEMVSLYYDQDGNLAMTHYCMLHNRPSMKLAKSGNQTLEFIFTESPGIDPARDSHMHALTIVFEDENHIIQNWTMFEKGKKKNEGIFELARVR